tara:strand:+ start:1735 stop:6456 length:4722 start_codon:yes stop_codon:yes gene_type:complete
MMRNFHALILVALLLFSSLGQVAISEIEESSSFTSGRSVDVSVSSVEIISPSAIIGGIHTLSNVGEFHEVRVTIVNLGTTASTGSLDLNVAVNSGSPSVADTVSFNLPGSSSEVHLLEWAQPSGTADISVSATAGGDSDPSNDQLSYPQTLTIQNSSAYVEVSNTLPNNGDVIGRDIWHGDWVFSNTGNVPFSVEGELILTPQGGGTPIPVTSSVTNAPPGSLSQNAGNSAVNLSFDGSPLSGTYTLGGLFRMSFSDGSTSDININSRNIVLSDSHTSVTPPANISVNPGSGTSLLFIVQNLGSSADSYTVEYSNVSGWVDDLSLPSTINNLASNTGAPISVPVNVPISADRSEIETVTIYVNSTTSGVSVTARASVLAGDLYQSDLQSNGSLVYIDPGSFVIVDYTLFNTGTSPAHFDLTAGLQENPDGWDVQINPSTTDLLSPGNSRSVTITISAPTLTSPLDPEAKISAGNRLHLRVTSTPVEGDSALAATNITDIEVRPSVSVSMIPSVEELVYTTAELEAGDMFKMFDLEVALLSNFPSGTLGSASITFTSSATQFSSVDGATYGSQETSRWNSSVGPNSTNLDLGESLTLVTSVLGPTEALPAAGVLNFTLTASTSLSGMVGITSPDTESSFQVIIETVIDGDLENSPITAGVPGSENDATMILTNTGNALSDYTLTTPGLPGWVVNFTPDAVTSLAPEVGTWPSGIDTVFQSVLVTATPPTNARADIVHEIEILLFDGEGSFVDNGTARFVLDEVIGALIEPDSMEIEVPSEGTQTASFIVRNMGNSLQTFDISTGNFVGGTDFTIGAPSSVTVEPGANVTLSVDVTALQSARADSSYSFELILEHNGTEQDRSTVLVGIEKIHDVRLSHDSSFQAIPGETLEIVVTLENLGNLREVGVFNLNTPEGWIQSSDSIDISPGETISGLIVRITVPALDSEEVPMAGQIYSIPILVVNSTDNLTIGQSNVSVSIKPVFQLVMTSSPSRIASIPGQSRDVSYLMKNAGNDAVVLDVTCSLDPSSSSRWSNPVCPATLELNIGQERWINLSMTPTDDRHWDKESGTLSFQFVPRGEVGGNASWTTPLVIERVQTDDPVILRGSDGPQYSLNIDWMHVPELSQTGTLSPSSYSLRYVSAERMVNDSLYPETLWSFAIAGGPNPLVPNDLHSLGSAAPYALDSFDLIVNMPDSSSIAPGDGWDLTFNLENLDEAGNRPGTSFVVKLRLDSYSDPRITEISFSDGSLVEGSTTELVVNVSNSGTAILPMNSVLTVSCKGPVEILDYSPRVIPPLGIQESIEVNWTVSAEALPWYITEGEFDCTFNLVLSDTVYGNLVDNDQETQTLSVDTWSPGFLISLISGILILVLSLFIFRRGLDDDERALHGSTYLAMLGLAVLARSSLIPEIGLICIALATLWMFVLSWLGAGEIQAIHDDRRKALIGERSALGNHAEEIETTRREVGWILLGAPIFFVMMMTLDPSLKVNTDIFSLGSSVGYIAILGVICLGILRYLDRLYGLLHNDLAALDIRTARIRGILQSRTQNRVNPFATPPPMPEAFNQEVESGENVGGEEE